jgi:hypothetical protein
MQEVVIMVIEVNKTRRRSSEEHIHVHALSFFHGWITIKNKLPDSDHQITKE